MTYVSDNYIEEVNFNLNPQVYYLLIKLIIKVTSTMDSNVHVSNSND